MARMGQETAATKMEQYMRNQFQFFGIHKPVRKAMTKAFWGSNELPRGEALMMFVNLLWEHPCREMQYHGLDLLVHQKKN